MRQQTASSPKTPSRSYPLLALFLLLSTALSLVWSHVRLMWNDEFLSFYSDGVATFKQVILVQLHHPISLDPPTYHLLSHLCMDILGRNAIALRLPALAGFLLFQLCLFFFVRRLAGDRSAIIAMAVPLLTASFRYSVEGRPYGLLLGLYALSLLCWQLATLDDDIPRNRIISLAGLTLSIALAITSHYFGVLILIPVSLGELSRTYIRKRLDFGVLTALALGLASVVLILPFQRALMVYRQHYYITGVNIRNISQGYRELFLRYTTWPMPLQKLAAAAMVVLTLALAYAAYQRFKRRPPTEHAYTWIALLSMALLPLFGYLLGRFVTHTMEVRYVIAALIAFAATFGIVLERRLRSNTFYYSALTFIAAAALVINTHNILQEHRASLAILASLQPSPALATALAANPTAPIYEQSLGNFFVDSYYTPDPALRARITLLYNSQREIFFLKHDTYSISANNLQHFTTLPAINYDQLITAPGPHLLIQWQDGWNWTDQAAASEHATVTPLGPSFGGQAVAVQWSQPNRTMEISTAH
ncbi:glycosyltransferase family 39 protein [Granulicella sp. L46]|uniref:glycosyltransferase family 39 protein n=1 Tax=Granulicella sp. L46 TaxID=1641865 RepID=UPI00131A666D|nr:glycosyltransferase family 39 protein [Granulicella sp. L46]